MPLQFTANTRSVASTPGLREATQTEAETGAILGRYMSPLRVAQFFDAQIIIPEPSAINVKEYGAVGDGSTDDTTALQTAINSAVAAGIPLFVPTGRYKYTAPLGISGNLSMYGAWVAENWGSGIGGVGINVPEGTPKLTGSVLLPSSNGQSALAVSNIAKTVHLSNLGIEFQTHFTGTGHGFYYPTGADFQGLSGSTFQNVKVYGHDGDHYAFSLENPIYSAFINCFSYGGGGWQLIGNSTGGAWHYGNCVFIQPYAQFFVGGTAHGMSLEANAGATLNLLTFVRPQMLSDHTIYPTNPVTAAQKTFTMDTDVLSVTLVSPNMETTVSSPFEWNPHPSNSMMTTGGVWPAGTVPVTLLATPQVLANIPGSNMQIQSGSSNNGAGTAIVTFAFPFSNACLAVMVTATNVTSLPFVNSFNTTGYSLTQADAGTVYYLAYGY